MLATVVGWSQALVLRLLADLAVCESGTAWDAASDDPVLAAAFLTSFWAALQPSLGAFVLASAVHVANSLRVMPEGLDNNGTYLLLIMVNVLHSSLWALVTGHEGGALLDEGAGRAITLALYFFAAFAKLNTGFFVTRCSASTVGTVALLKLFPDKIWPSPSPMSAMLPRIFVLLKAAVFLTEWAVPLLLLTQSRYALLLALAMHHAMGVAGFWVFSVVMQATVCLLFAPAASAALLARVAAHPLWNVTLAGTVLFLLAAHNNPRLHLPAALARAVKPLRLRATLLPGESGCYLQAVWAVWSSLLLFACVVVPLEPELDLTLLPESGVGWATLAIAIALGCSPYLGGRTHASWTMYSNLRLEGSVSNHFFCGPRMQVFGCLRETCTVLDSTDPSIRNFCMGIDAAAAAGPRLAALLNTCDVEPLVWWNSHGCYGSFLCSSTVYTLHDS